MERLDVLKTRCQARKAVRELKDQGKLRIPESEGQEIEISYAGTIIKLIGLKGGRFWARLKGL